MRKTIVLLSCLFFFTASMFAQKEQVLHFYVEAGNYERINTLVGVDLENIAIPDTLSFRLTEKVKGGTKNIPYQIEQGYTHRLWFILDGVTPANKKREFFLYTVESQQSFDNVMQAVVTNEDIILKKDDSEILHYRTAVQYPPEGANPAYVRYGGFIHPMKTPAGNILTRIGAPDHYHHFGIWNPWTRVKIDDHVTDFWNLVAKQGTVRYAGTNSTATGPVFCDLSVRQEHIDFQGKNPEEIAITETWDVRAWNAEPLTGKKAFLVDFTTFFTNIKENPIIFQAYRYGGGIGIRATEQWNNQNSTVLTSEGKTRKDADGSTAKWVDLNGVFKDKGNSGITFFSHPTNRAHPESMRVWPENANKRGDVYFEFCPTRHIPWTIESGKQNRLKYRILVYDGQIDKDTAEKLWTDFACPPKVITLRK